MSGYHCLKAAALTVALTIGFLPGRADAQTGLKLPEGMNVNINVLSGVENIHFSPLPTDTVKFSPLSFGGSASFQREKLIFRAEGNIGVSAHNVLSAGARLGNEQAGLELGVAKSNVGLSFRAAADFKVSDPVLVYLRADFNPASLFSKNIAGGGKALEAGLEYGSGNVKLNLGAELRRRSAFDELPRELRNYLPPSVVGELKAIGRPEMAVVAKLQIGL